MVEHDPEPGAEFSASVTRPDDGTVIVHASGELDMLTAPRLQALLDSLGGERTGLVLDFDGLEFIDSTGVHLVLRTVLDWRAQQRDVALRGAGPEILRAFELVGLADRLPFQHPGQSSS